MAADEAIAALRGGKPVLLPTDTVYGLCASPYGDAAVARLYRLKGRSVGQPTALLTGSVDMLFECVPELRGRAGVIARALLPGPYTLVLSNPAARFRWLTGDRPDTIGVRVPDLPAEALRVVDALGAVAATSANDPGGPDPCRIEDVPERLRQGCGAEVDVGELPGTPSTVLDLTGPEPRVLREGAVSSADALARVAAALA